MKSDSPNEACTPMSDNGINTSSTFLTTPSIAPGIPIDDDKMFTMTLKSDGSYVLSSKGKKTLTYFDSHFVRRTKLNMTVLTLSSWIKFLCKMYQNLIEVLSLVLYLQSAACFVKTGLEHW